MSTVDRITNLAKQKGITQAFISSKIGVHRNWLSCVRRDNVKISGERLAIIADILGTTTAYLKGETNDPETGNKKSPSELDELLQQPDITELLALYRSLPEKEQKRALSVLKALKESE